MIPYLGIQRPEFGKKSILFQFQVDETACIDFSRSNLTAI